MEKLKIITCMDNNKLSLQENLLIYLDPRACVYSYKRYIVNIIFLYYIIPIMQERLYLYIIC
jgi:hypothetical protein